MTTPTDVIVYYCGLDSVIVRIYDLPSHFSWELVVNGVSSDRLSWTRCQQNGEYFAFGGGYGEDKDFVPFKMTWCKKL